MNSDDYNNEPVRRGEFREDLREFRQELRTELRDFRQDVKLELRSELKNALTPALSPISERLTSLEKGQKFIFWALSGIFALCLVVSATLMNMPFDG